MGLFAKLGCIPTYEDAVTPQGYQGLHAFHKYWGKKPLEPLAFLVDRLTNPGDLVVDPFMGSGGSGVETVRLGRRFVGIDLNPIAVRLASVVLSPPSISGTNAAMRILEKEVKGLIQESYSSPSDQFPITHYLWEDSNLIQLWVSRGRAVRRVYQPTAYDLDLSRKFDGYGPRKIRQPRFFTNSRINARPNLTLNDLFTGRALRNIELILEALSAIPPSAQMALSLSLTAGMGQMSKMVFAITGRGKTTGATSQKIEVGSWVIGFWRPPLHFEVNVWNCFEHRVKKLIFGLGRTLPGHHTPGGIQDVLHGLARYSLVEGDALAILGNLPDCSVDLIMTDPPHCDRVPYLELSELWNSLLGLEADFSAEIVVSDAKEREKSFDEYNLRMKGFLRLAMRKVKPTGALALIFNARDTLSWQFLTDVHGIGGGGSLPYIGHFPLEYSATSVVQDNREGSLRNDYALIFSSSSDLHRDRLVSVPGWSTSLPSPKRCR